MVRKRNTKKSKSNGPKDQLRQQILEIYQQNPLKGFNYKQIASRMGKMDKATRDLIGTILFELFDKGITFEIRPGKYKINPEYLSEIKSHSPTLDGTVDMKQTGKAYVIPEDGGEDVFISANNTYHAFHQDKVRVRLFPKRPGRKLEGQIIEILKPRKKQFVGVIEIAKNFAFFIPDSQNVPVDIFIPKENLKNAKNGQKVIVKLLEWPEHSKNPFGEVTDVLGYPGNNNVEMQSILAEHDFPLSFPESAEKEAEKIPGTIPAEEIAKRKDFRKVFTLTIDPEDAKDFDDALSLQMLGNGNWEVGIHIADVSHYVKPNTSIDEEGFNRATSIYLVDRVIPMLPEKLSNNVCSLNANEDKLCFSAVFEMNEDAEVLDQWFGKTVINSDRRFNYDEVQHIIEREKGEYSYEIMNLHHLSSKLREKRFNNGSINFETQEVKFRLDENGKPIEAYIKEQKDSNKLIEDFMLLANKKVAEFIGKVKGRQKPKTFIYRIHDTPNPEKLATFVQFLDKLGYRLNIGSRKSIASSFNKLFKDIANKGEKNMIETIAIRTMAKAVYSTLNIGHYGLAFPYYTHFTSPIRRYPDLMVHRLLEKYLDGGSSANQKEYEEYCVHCSEMERKAIDAERTSVKYKQAEFLMDKIGQEFEGLISGVSKWGIYVELIGNKCEGMVRLQDLRDDFYYLDQDNYQVIGQRNGQQYKLGDNVRIKVKRIDINKKQMDFQLIN
ncbi:ribonuclease R [Bacteroidota bacterium]